MEDILRTAWKTFFVSGYWIRVLVFFLASLCLMYLHGRFWSRLLKRKDHPLELLCMGLVSILALEQLFCWPVVAFRLSADLLLWLTLAVLLLPSAAALFLKGEGRERDPVPTALLLLTVLIVAAAAAGSVFEYRPNSDDSFYVSNVAMFSRAAFINRMDSSMGDVTAGTVPMYDFQTWESLVSVICRIFRIKATTAMHTLVVAPLIAASASAYFVLGRALLKDSGKALLFVGVITVFHMGSRFYSYCEGEFLLSRIWQGKSVNLTAVLPLLSAEVVRLFESEEKRPPVRLWLCVLAGVGLNPTSLYVNGFELLFLSVAMAAAAKRADRLPSLLPAVLITAAFTLMIYLRTRSCAGKIESASTVDPDFFLTALKAFFQDAKKYDILYALSLLYILFRGNRPAKVYFLLTGAFMLVFLWNPWAGRFVAEKITKGPTYWRVFWLVPVGAGIAWAAADMAFSVPKRMKALAGALLLLLVGLFGSWPLDRYTPAQNVEKVSPPVMKLIDDFRKEPVSSPVLACQAAATVLRQEDTDLWLLVAKRTYVQDVYTYFGREEEGSDRLLLYDFVNNELEDLSAVPALLEKYGVERVIVTKKNEAARTLLEEQGWILRAKARSYFHYEKSDTAAQVP